MHNSHRPGTILNGLIYTNKAKHVSFYYQYVVHAVSQDKMLMPMKLGPLQIPVRPKHCISMLMIVTFLMQGIQGDRYRSDPCTLIQSTYIYISICLYAFSSLFRNYVMKSQVSLNTTTEISVHTNKYHFLWTKLIYRDLHSNNRRLSMKLYKVEHWDINKCMFAVTPSLKTLFNLN